jgi:CBS domain-containing protein
MIFYWSGFPPSRHRLAEFKTDRDSGEKMSTGIYKKRVKEIVTKHIVNLNADDTIHEALVLMGENRVSALPVVDRQNRCVGILSTVDLVDMTRDTEEDLRELNYVDLLSKRFLVDKLANSMGTEKVQTFMSESVITVGLESFIGDAAQQMLRNHVHHLPVVDHDNRLLGIISTMDILSEFVDAEPA